MVAAWLKRHRGTQTALRGGQKPRLGTKAKLLLEHLEDRVTPATITGNSGPGGFEASIGPSSLQLWFDANSLSALADGSAVSSWANSSAATGAGTSASQATANRQPTLQSDAA